MRQDDIELYSKSGTVFDNISANTLIAFPERGVAYFPVTTDHGKDYFTEYALLARTDMGIKINTFRTNFVKKYYCKNKAIVDIGIGSGQFVSNYGSHIFGYDINEKAINWLKTHGFYINPYTTDCEIDVMTFWDSIEHIEDFGPLLRRVQEWVFISTPIYHNIDHHLLTSRHFKKDEHCWYFTHIGLADIMYRYGFLLASSSREETKLGRDGITTFAFRRC